MEAVKPLEQEEEEVVQEKKTTAIVKVPDIP